jgi:hypothetical protein
MEQSVFHFTSTTALRITVMESLQISKESVAVLLLKALTMLSLLLVSAKTVEI